MSALFAGFSRRKIKTGGATINLVTGGKGPAVLLLHGYPETHAMWHKVAPTLAREYTVVCPDLRGYGASTVPPDAADHAQASKRAMASDVVALMDALGHERFALAGHDRGGYAAFRTAMDHPQRIAALTTFGRAVPIIETLERMDVRFAREWWHWFFLGQTSKPAERVIAAIGPDDWYRTHGPEVMGADAHEDVWAALRNPDVVHGMCEDYRAGLTIDAEHDRADRAAGRRVRCPVQSVWATQDDPDLFGPDPLALLRGWTDDLRGTGIDSGHHVAEEAPEATAEALSAFWAEVGWA
jgi:haloacetate dehalogenase